MPSALEYRVKTECTAVFVEADAWMRDNSPEFGTDDEHASLLGYLTSPSKNFPKWKSLWMSSALKTYAFGSNDALHKLNNIGLQAFHYRVDSARFDKNVARKLEDERFFEVKSNGRYQSDHTSAKGLEKIEHFRRKYRNMSCLYTNVWTTSSLIGPSGLMQEVTDYCKTGPNETLGFLRYILGPAAAALEQELARWSELNIYDLEKEPRYTHLPLSPHLR